MRKNMTPAFVEASGKNTPEALCLGKIEITPFCAADNPFNLRADAQPRFFEIQINTNTTKADILSAVKQKLMKYHNRDGEFDAVVFTKILQPVWSMQTAGQTISTMADIMAVVENQLSQAQAQGGLTLCDVAPKLSEFKIA